MSDAELTTRDVIRSEPLARLTACEAENARLRAEVERLQGERHALLNLWPEGVGGVWFHDRTKEWLCCPAPSVVRAFATKAEAVREATGVGKEAEHA